ncbi:MAG: M20/M25/M40 family metallo-hydrolase [Clostridia bacterium]|nr:M20/M25/M40 family metallo-hydrolase [Clostridia bacterium]
MISKEKQQQVYDYIDTQLERYIEELSALIRCRSMSAEGTGMVEGAGAVAEMVKKSGFEAEVNILESGFPIVTGQTGSSKDKRVGIYGHYDVFPEGDVTKWVCDPFDPKVIDGKLYGRATTDDKGNLFANVKAAEAVKNVLGELPVDLAFLFEGEEEVGSVSLEGFLKENSSKLGKLDGFIASDRGWHESGRPCMYLGCKSNITFTAVLRYAERTFHSGQAPLIPNPAWELLHVLSKLRDEKGNIRVPALDGKRIIPTNADIKLLHTIPFTIDEYKATYGLDHIMFEESDLDTLTHLVFDATCNLDNVYAGTPESNCIVPGFASATIDMRLPGDYDPYEVERSLVSYIESLNPNIEVTTFITHGYRADSELPFISKVIDTVKSTTGLEPVVWPSWDGAGPLGILHRAFDVPAMIIGLGTPFSIAHTHTYDEYLDLEILKKSIKMMAGVFMNAFED